jgi:hypothetical protein
MSDETSVPAVKHEEDAPLAKVEPKGKYIKKGVQDDEYVEPVPSARGARKAAPKTKYLKKSVSEVMADARGEIKHPSRNWKGLCLRFCREQYGVPAFAPSATAAWNMIPRQHKHYGPASQAPRGAMLYFVDRDGTGYGHVILAAGIVTHNKAIGIDYVRQGKVDFCPRTIPNWLGGLKYVGWSLWTPFGELRADD